MYSYVSTALKYSVKTDIYVQLC